MNEFLLIGGMAAVTFLIRYPVLAIFSRIELPPTLIRALRYVPVAVLTAITVPEMVFRNGEPVIAFSNSHLVAGILAVGIAWYTQKILPTIVIGMAIFLLLRAFAG